jgi:hypothetical protein
MAAAFACLPVTGRAGEGDTVRFLALGDLEGGTFSSGASAISADGLRVFGASRVGSTSGERDSVDPVTRAGVSSERVARQQAAESATPVSDM